jgi:hypothetical protein
MYDAQWQVFDQAQAHGWNGERPGVLGTYRSNQAFQNAQRFLEAIAKEDPTCEETHGYDEDADMYLRCGKLAAILVQHRGRTEGPYWMCRFHAAHNIDNRNAEDITPERRNL